jgi:subtilisin
LTRFLYYKNIKLTGILTIFFLLYVNQYLLSNYFLADAMVSIDPEVPVELTGKIIINPPECPKEEKYDKDLDKCVSNSQSTGKGNGSGNGGSGNGGGSIETPDSVRPPSLILAANRSDVETKSGGQDIPFQQIVIVNDSLVKNAQSLRETVQALTKIVEVFGAEIVYRYNSSVTGFAFKAPNQQVTDDIISVLSPDPRVKFMEQDKTVVPFSEEVPTGLQRIDANGLYSIPKLGSFSADVDIAIVDSGIDLDNPDLNVYSNISFMIPQVTQPHKDNTYSIINNNVDLDRLGLNISAVGSNNTTSFDPPFTADLLTSGDDRCGHGTHVAGIAAAEADSHGVVGMAPDARLWAIKVLDYNKFTGRCEGSISSIIAAIEYVTKLKNQIEIVNLSLGCKCNSTALDDAISKAIRSNITVVVAAGNINSDASKFSPANHKDVIAVSAITDLDGKCGGLSKPKWINAGQFSGLYGDDTFSRFSNYGKAVDIAAPGVMINSTDKNGSYSLSNGTSMAAPHVAGAAALYKILDPGLSPSDIRNALVRDGIQSSVACDGGRHGYFNKDPDHTFEPLLYVDGLVKKIKEKFDNIPSRGDDKT